MRLIKTNDLTEDIILVTLDYTELLKQSKNITEKITKLDPDTLRLMSVPELGFIFSLAEDFGEDFPNDIRLALINLDLGESCRMCLLYKILYIDYNDILREISNEW